MNHRNIFFIFLYTHLAFSYGASVMTLNFPIGAAGAGMGETGVSYSENLSSVFYNPAHPAFFHREQNLALIMEAGFEPILPELQLPDLWHSAGAVSYAVPQLFPSIDAAFSIWNNFLHFGEVTHHEDNRTSRAYEWAMGYTVSGAWKEYIGTGITVKHFTSIFEKDSAEARGAAFDFGLRGQYHFDLPRGIRFTPSAGVSLANIGDSVSYSDSERNNTIPRTLRSGIGLRTTYTPLADLLLTYDNQVVLYSTRTESLPMHNWGAQLRITPFTAFRCGFLYDRSGSREEFSLGWGVGYNRAHFHEFIHGPGEYRKSSNIRIWYDGSVIAKDGTDQIRSGQHHHTLSFGFYR
jgi:hypothetical protein